MDEKTIAMLKQMADKYNTPNFIEDDPIQFPRRYKHSQVDAEISAILTSAISFGNRKQIIKAARVINDAFAGDPLGFILEREYLKLFKYSGKFYRMIDGMDMRRICNYLYLILVKHGHKVIEDDFYGNANCYKAIYKDAEDFPGIAWLSSRFYCVMGKFYGASPLKRINMLLRWMVRNDGIVDLGLWKFMNPKDLIIPLDTHVHRKALELGLTKRKTANMNTAIEITNCLKEVFPDDPTLGDFALFGMGVNEDRI